MKKGLLAAVFMVSGLMASAQNPQGAQTREQALPTPVYLAEQMPTFQGGDLNSFGNWLMANIVFPADGSGEASVFGKVVVSFIIEKDGRLGTIEIIRTPSTHLSDALVRVLETSPRWEPGRQNGEPVRVFVILPVDIDPGPDYTP